VERPRDQLKRNQASHGPRRPAEVLGGVGQVRDRDPCFFDMSLFIFVI